MRVALCNGIFLSHLVLYLHHFPESDQIFYLLRGTFPYTYYIFTGGDRNKFIRQGQYK